MSATIDTDERYTIISADCHAGGSHAAYREYLDPAFLEDFDAWRGKYKNPYKDLGDNRRLRNWDNEMRNSPAGGRRRRRRGRVPEHGAAVLPELRAVRPAAEAPTSTSTAGRRPRPQPLARRLVRRVPRAPRRRRPDLPQRRRRRHRGRAAGSRSTACGAAILLPNIAPDVQVGEAALRPGLRPAVGGAARTSRSPSTCTAAPATPTTARTRRRCCSTSTRSSSTRSGPFVQLRAVGRVRALPAPQVRDDRGRLRVGAAAARPTSTPPSREHPRHRRDRARSATAPSTCCPRTPPSTSTRTAGWA